MDVLDSKRVPLNRDERALRLGDVPYYGATGQVGWIDEPIFDEELVLLGEDGAPFLDPAKAKAYLIAGPSWVNNHAHVLRAKREATANRFLMHYLNACSYEGHVTGTTRLKLTQAAMRAMPFLRPPLAEQERIVLAIEEHLSRLGAAEAAVREATVRLGYMEASLANAALDGGWPIQRLGDRTVDQRYGTSAKTGGQGEVPVLRMGNIQNGVLDWTNLKYLPAEHRDFPVCLLERGDLLFNRTNSGELVGKTAVFKGADLPTSFASYLIRVRLDENLMPEWAALVMNSTQGRRYIDDVRTQNVGQSNVNGTKLKAFPVPVPPISVQRDRVTEVERQRLGLRRLRTDLNVASSTAAALRRSILAAAFSGRLVAQGSTAEPADVLMARIAEVGSSTGTKRRAPAQPSTKVKEASS